MNYERIKNFPTSRNGKTVYGIASALVAREMINQGMTLYETNPDGALISFLMAGVLVFTIVLALARLNTGRPLFEEVTR